MQKQLTGTISSINSNDFCITADNGDLYDFKTDLVFNVGDRVIFDPIDSQVAFDLAMLGGPIPCENVKLIK